MLHVLPVLLFLSPMTRFDKPYSVLNQVGFPVAAAPLIHVAGTNSAIFDFYLGRHVHEAGTAAVAWKRARPGEAVVAWLPASEPGPDARASDPVMTPSPRSREMRVWWAIKPPKERP